MRVSEYFCKCVTPTREVFSNVCGECLRPIPGSVHTEDGRLIGKALESAYKESRYKTPKRPRQGSTVCRHNLEPFSCKECNGSCDKVKKVSKKDEEAANNNWLSIPDTFPNMYQVSTQGFYAGLEHAKKEIKQSITEKLKEVWLNVKTMKVTPNSVSQTRKDDALHLIEEMLKDLE